MSLLTFPYKLFIKSFWEDLKAKRRGEVRVAPRHVRGRVYKREHELNMTEEQAQRHADSAGGVAMDVRSKPKVTMRARVKRGDGVVEDLGVVAEGENVQVSPELMKQLEAQRNA